MRHLIPVTLLAATIFLGGCAGSSNIRESSGARQLDPATLIGMRGSSMDMQLADAGYCPAAAFCRSAMTPSFSPSGQIRLKVKITIPAETPKMTARFQ